MKKEKTACGVCGKRNVNDLNHGSGALNLYCCDCGARFYNNRWWTSKEWLDYVNAENQGEW